VLHEHRVNERTPIRGSGAAERLAIRDFVEMLSALRAFKRATASDMADKTVSKVPAAATVPSRVARNQSPA